MGHSLAGREMCTLPPNSFTPILTLTVYLPFKTWQVRREAQGLPKHASKTSDLKRSQSGLRVESDLGGFPGAAGVAPLGTSFVLRPQMCLCCKQMWPWVRSGNGEGVTSGSCPCWPGKWPTAPCKSSWNQRLPISLGKLRQLSSFIKCKGFCAAELQHWLINDVDGINYLGCGNFMLKPLKLNIECFLKWLGGSGIVKAGSQRATVSPSENGDVGIFLF